MNSSPEPSSDCRLHGSIERVVYFNPDNGYAVLRVRVRDCPGSVTVTGNISAAHPGQMLEAEGKWEITARHGRQFRARTLATVAPASAEGLQRYLASGLIKGIGPRMAARLIEAFGDRVLEVIENSPQRLSRVRGIGSARRRMIERAWARQRHLHHLMAFLHSHGLSGARASRIYRAYGEGAVEAVRNDPYRLTREIRGIGFLGADRVARSLGIAPDSRIRLRAGLFHCLELLAEEGHCAARRRELISRAVELLEADRAAVETALGEELAAVRLVSRSSADGEDLVMLPGLDAAEAGVVRRLAALIAGGHPSDPFAVSRALDWVEERVGFPLSSDQKQALRRACSEPVTVVTGGPGVGKTTLIRALVEIFGAKGLKVVLAAPTGRAARKMGESTKHPAATIHRLLEYDPRRAGFTRNRDRPLDLDVLVVDEFSMVDISLAWSLLEAVPSRAALVIVGDADQLPSVGPGCVLQDIIESGAVPVVRLSEIFRQGVDSRIVHNAHRVNAGLLPSLQSEDGQSDFFFLECDDPDRGVETVCDLVARRLPRYLEVNPIEDIQVLSPMRRGELGVLNLNARLQEVLNPGSGGVESLGLVFRPGDRVMQQVNDYDKDVFNGDIGLVLTANEEEGTLLVDFDGRRLAYSRGDLDELTLSYAISIHKSQGSEYPAVVIALHTQHYLLLRRNLLYTAITRGAKLVVIVGSRRALEIAVSRRDTNRRLTLLSARLGAATFTPG